MKESPAVREDVIRARLARRGDAGIAQAYVEEPQRREA
jgi:hypothetical protein